MDEIVVVGAGGFGKEVWAYCQDLEAAGRIGRLAGVLDDDHRSVRWAGEEIPVLGTTFDARSGGGTRYVIAVGSPHGRRLLADRLAERGAELATIVHPTAWVAPTASLGPGTIVAPFAFVGPEAQLGANVALNIYASVGHDAVLGGQCVLSPYATVNGNVVLEEAVFLGTHATVLARLRVGAEARVAAGAVVYRDVPAQHLAQGDPARSRGLSAAPPAPLEE
jgi:sugar O-acyltransferase (sialic acid O-acetyltransferase NeuD family)